MNEFANTHAAELHLCLSRAFLVPGDPATCNALRAFLVPDLAELCGLLGLEAAAPLDGLAASLAALPDDEALLACYSRMFLVPPPRARINAAFYLDGAVMGGSVDRLVALYREFGLEGAAHLHDLPDHVAVQLEFAAHLWARDAAAAARFLGGHVAPWAEPLAADLAGAGEAPNPWLHLAELVRRAAHALGVAEERAALPADQAAVLAARAQWAARELEAVDRERIAARLRARGLSAEHVLTGR